VDCDQGSYTTKASDGDKGCQLLQKTAINEEVR